MTVRAPELLSPTAYLQRLQPANGGLRAQTHKAIVRDKAGTARRAFVKQFPPGAPRGLFNEWFGYTFMSALGVPLADSAIMQAPDTSGKMTWSFVSFEPRPRNDGTAKEIYDVRSAQQLAALAARLLTCDAFYSITAADELCINGDRNLGNVVFTDAKTFVAIDHSDILGGPAWTQATLAQSQQWCPPKLLDFCSQYATLSSKQKDRLIAAADVATEMFAASEADLRKTLNEPDAVFALDIIRTRNTMLGEWYRATVGLLI